MSSTNQSFSRDQVEVAFKKMPTYNDAKKHFKVCDLGQLVKVWGYACTPEQFVEYEKIWAGPFEGLVPLDVFAALMVALDDNAKLMRILITALDKDKNGFISESEFKATVTVLLSHNPAFPKVDYETFLHEADTNKDGKISIDEAVTWFGKQGARG